MSRQNLKRGRNARRLHGRRKRALLVCGGEVTEPEYFRIPCKEKRWPLTVKSVVGSPQGLVNEARKIVVSEDRLCIADGMDTFEFIAIVTDVDDFHDHRVATNALPDSRFKLIISNPCFEVWIIDHVEQCPASIRRTRDAQILAQRLGVTQGNRGKHVKASSVVGRLSEAIVNAKAHNVHLAGRRSMLPGGELDYAPWTDMPFLIEESERLFTE